MRNLLHANFSRLFHSGAFRAALAAEFAYALFIIGATFYSIYFAGGGRFGLEEPLLFAFGIAGMIPVPMLIQAPFLSVYLGTEFSEGTIRNNLVTGRSKAAVYDEWGRDAAGMLPNPNYLQPVPRAVCRFPIDLLPTGQCLQISARSVEQFWRMPLLSLSAIAASTCAGLLLFRRKDLK